MKPAIILLLCLSGTWGALGQSLTGEWKGTLAQKDKSFDYLMQATIVQNEHKITGQTQIMVPETKEYVIEKFTGTVQGNQVTIIEYEVVDSYIAPSSGFNWCIKTLKGQVTIHTEQNTMTIAGNWSSNKAWSRVWQTSYECTCPPGTFILSKKLYHPM